LLLDNHNAPLKAADGSDAALGEVLKKKKITSGSQFPIWLQLSLAITLIVILTIVLLNFFILSRQKEHLYQQTLKIGMVSLTYFDTNARIPLLEDNILRLNTLIKDAAEVEGLLYALIVDHQKNIKAHTDHKKIGTVFKQVDDISGVHKEGDTSYFDYTLPTGERVLNLSRPIIFKGKQLGEVHVGVSIDFIEQDVRRERLSILWMTLLILLLGIAIAIYFGFRFSRPISELVRATHEIAKGNYQYKIDLTRKDELGNLAVSFNQMNQELWVKSLMQESFGKYVGTQVLDLIMENPEDSWLKGQTNDATILFADIRGFTTYSESKAPKVLVDELNEYFEIANTAILNHNGYIDKFIGDAVLAVFGVPVYQKNHVLNGVRAAFEMQHAFRRAAKKGKVLLASIGIGIHSGTVVSGNIGSPVKMEYTVIGDSVNVASRISKIAAPGEIIISRSIYEHVAEVVEVEPLPPQKIRGKTDVIDTFKALTIKER
jgi:adenylate cyclase